MAWEYNAAERVKCPLCGQIFEDEKIGEDMPDKDPEKQAHFKALIHHRKQHPNQRWKGVVPVE